MQASSIARGHRGASPIFFLLETFSRMQSTPS